MIHYKVSVRNLRDSTQSLPTILASLFQPDLVRDSESPRSSRESSVQYLKQAAKVHVRPKAPFVFQWSRLYDAEHMVVVFIRFNSLEIRRTVLAVI